ncbi:MAG: hypothetical protein KKC26_07740 [Nanoarchaeota archaeon]|nr:hypothetical protein [Nanoarchaeota archaeon]
MTQLQIGIQPYDIPFHYHPKDLEDIVVEENIEDKIWAKPKQIFITMSPDVTPNEGIAAVEIAKLTGNRYKLFNIPTKSALTKPNNLTISITCMDAKEDVVVINFKKNKQNIVYSSGNCIHVEYVDSNESIRVASAFAYHILKIM